MFEDKKARIHAAHLEFEAALAERSPGTHGLGEAYLRALDEYCDVYLAGPAADDRVRGLDTTGELKRVAEFSRWVVEERRRVRERIAALA